MVFCSLKMTRGVGARKDRSPTKAPVPTPASYEGSRGAEISQVEAEGRTGAEGVVTYSEVDVRPTTMKVKGHQTVAFYGCGIYARERLAEQKRMQS